MELPAPVLASEMYLKAILDEMQKETGILSKILGEPEKDITVQKVKEPRRK